MGVTPFVGAALRRGPRRGVQPAFEHAPAIDLSELSRRIGTQIVRIEDDRPLPGHQALVTDAYDRALFTIVGEQRFFAAREDRRACAVVVLRIDLVTRRDAPQNAPALPLEGLARAIRANTRDNDVAARYGADEFVLFLDQCDADEARRIVERLTRSLVSIPFTGGTLTACAGIAVHPERGDELGSLVQQADAMLRGIRRGGIGEVRVA